MQTDILHFLLTYLASEASEVSHAATKVILFGPEDTYAGRIPTTAQQTLQAEVNDLLAVVECLNDCGLDILRDPEQIRAKKDKMRQMLEYIKSTGTGFVIRPETVHSPVDSSCPPPVPV